MGISAPTGPDAVFFLPPPPDGGDCTTKLFQREKKVPKTRLVSPLTLPLSPTSCPPPHSLPHFKGMLSRGKRGLAPQCRRPLPSISWPQQARTRVRPIDPKRVRADTLSTTERKKRVPQPYNSAAPVTLALRKKLPRLRRPDGCPLSLATRTRTLCLQPASSFLSRTPTLVPKRQSRFYTQPPQGNHRWWEIRECTRGGKERAVSKSSVEPSVTFPRCDIGHFYYTTAVLRRTRETRVLALIRIRLASVLSA